MSEEGKLVVLRETATSFHAELIAGVLENAGIEAHVEDSTPVYDFARHASGKGVRIFVPEDRLREAEELVAAMDEDGGEASGGPA